MRAYQKPIILQNEELAEGIYLASGDAVSGGENQETGAEDKTCRFGRKNVKVNASDCRKCVASGGLTVSNEDSSNVPGHMTITADQCPDNMPEKKKQ